jgi:L-ribulokinase
MTDLGYVIGMDFGTASVRCLIVRISDGFASGSCICEYPHGDAGVITSDDDPDLARQHPMDYIDGLSDSLKGALEAARQADESFMPENIIGIGIATTGSTPIPLDSKGLPLAFQPAFRGNPDVMAWLWKDHTSKKEAIDITDLASEEHPEYLAKCGGVYSSEWYWAKILHCIRHLPDIVNAASDWVECSDWIPAILTGNEKHPMRGICAAGHKAMYSDSWGGYPDHHFLKKLHPALAKQRNRLEGVRAVSSDHRAGLLTDYWAAKLGLPVNLPVSVGAFDAHLGSVASGIKPGTLVKVMGTSSCDMMVAPMIPAVPDIPGICGIVPGSILPGFYSLEAGQAALGDLFNWWVTRIHPEGETHHTLSEKASRLKPGESGLLALDWNNGNRNVLVDMHLSGLLLGQTLQTRPEEIYRALIEAAAFGARMIINRIKEYGVSVEQIVVCGGIAEKNPFLLQLYADILQMPIRVASSAQTCAMGAAIAGSVAAGAYSDFLSAQSAMTNIPKATYHPNSQAGSVYNELFELYRNLHDSFGIPLHRADISHVMKTLITIREGARK